MSATVRVCASSPDPTFPVLVIIHMRIIKFIKKYFKNFDDSLINPPKERFDKKDFKGQRIYKRKVGEGGPIPNPEAAYYRSKMD